MSAIQKMPATLSICVCLNKKNPHMLTQKKQKQLNTERSSRQNTFETNFTSSSLFFNFVTLFIIQVVVPHSWFVTYRFRLYSLKKKKQYNFFQIWCLEGLQQKRMTKKGLERELENEVRIQEIHYKEELRQQTLIISSPLLPQVPFDTTTAIISCS